MNALSFRGKILLMLATALVALLFMAVSSLMQQRSQIIESRSELLTTAVQSAHSIVASYQAKAASGAMPVAEAQKAAKEALRVSRFGGADGKTEYFYIWTLDSKGVMHPIKPEWEGQDMAGKVKDGAGTDILKKISDALRASSSGRVFVPTMFARPGSQALVPKLQYVIRVDGWNWMVGSGLYTDDIDQLVRKTLLSNLAIVLAVMLVVGGVGLLVARSVLRQIGGEPTEAIAVMSEVARGNLDATIPAAPAGSLLDGLGHMVTSLRQLVTEVRAATESIATASSEIAQGNNDLAHRTEDTASNLQSTASSMEELTSTVRQTSDSAQTANQMATSAAAVAARGGRSGVAGGVHHAGHQCQQQQDQRHHRGDRRHRLSDQHPGTERRRRGRPCRRSRPGFCRGGQRGTQPGRAQCRGSQGNQGTHQCLGREGGIGHAAGGQCGGHHDRDRGKRSARDRHHW